MTFAPHSTFISLDKRAYNECTTLFLFTRIFEGLHSLSCEEKMPQPERRRTPRKLVSIRASMRPDNGGLLTLPIPGKITDLNRTGAMLHAKETLRQGNECMLTLLADDGVQAEIKARIIWARRNPNLEYDAGLAFGKLSPAQEALVDLYLTSDAN